MGPIHTNRDKLLKNVCDVMNTIQEDYLKKIKDLYITSRIEVLNDLQGFDYKFSDIPESEREDFKAKYKAEIDKYFPIVKTPTPEQSPLYKYNEQTGELTTTYES